MFLKCLKYEFVLYICYTNGNKMTQEIKVGDLVSGSYKFGHIYGTAIKVSKNKVLVNRCQQYFYQLQPTGEEVNVTRNRISQVNPEGHKVVAEIDRTNRDKF